MLETSGIYQNHNDDCIGMVTILNQICSYDVINSNTALKTLLFFTVWKHGSGLINLKYIKIKYIFYYAYYTEQFQKEAARQRKFSMFARSFHGSRSLMNRSHCFSFLGGQSVSSSFLSVTSQSQGAILGHKTH